MSDAPYDIHTMILERVKGEDLSEAARVTTLWRSYISSNRDKLRPIHCDTLRFTFMDCNGKLTVDASPKRESAMLKDYASLDPIYKYTSKTITFTMLYMSDEMKEELEDLLRAIPAWWIKQFKSARVIITHATFCAFTSRMNCIDTLIVTPNLRGSPPIEASKEMVRRSKEVKRFSFPLEGSFDGTVLEEIKKNAVAYPTEHRHFPYIKGHRMITIQEFASFLESVPLSRDDSPYYWLKISVLGPLEEFLSWIKLYEAEFECETQPEFMNERFKIKLNGSDYVIDYIHCCIHAYTTRMQLNCFC